MFKVGDKFESFEQFQTKLHKYEIATYNNYWVRDCKTLKTQLRRYPNGVAAQANLGLKYYNLRVACIKGGRQHVAKNVKKKTLTFKQGCPAGMFLKISSCGKYLQLREINEEHNHTVSKTLFNTLPHQRLNMPAEIKVSSQQVLQARGNKKIIQIKNIEHAGCLISLKDLSNLSRKPECKKGFSDCVDILKNIYNCDVDVLWDIEENLLCLFFQDIEMKKMFAVYPEIIFVDGTYCLHASRAATYLIMVEDSEGNGAVVAAGILLKENEETIDWFIKQFKKRNPNTVNIKVIMSDKESKERLSFKKNFPGASLQICLFHTLQIFNRQVNPKNMNISNEECETARKFLTKLAYSTSEDVYKEEFKNMKTSVPKIVIDYYDKNWHPIKNQWVLYLTFNNILFLNKTNNKLENLNKQLKSVILRYSNLEEFIKNFFICINSTRVNRYISNSIQFHKVSTNLLPENSPEYSYKNYLTNYAFEIVQQQISYMKDCSNFKVIDENKCLVPTSEGLLEVTDKTCQCLFSSSMGLPCRHIFKYRSTMNLPLFDKDICLSRWTRSYIEAEHPFLKIEEMHTSQLSESRTENSVDKKRALTNHQKFKLMNDECLKLSKLCSEVSSSIFYKRLEIVKNLVSKWSNDDEEYPEPGKNDKAADETINCNVTQVLELVYDSAHQSECMDTCDSDYEQNNDEPLE